MCVFRYLKTPDIILSLVSLKKLNWTHSFDTHCTVAEIHLKRWGEGKALRISDKFVLILHIFFNNHGKVRK